MTSEGNSRGELWLIRHGETAWTRSGAHTSTTDLPLTADGEARAAGLRRILEGRRFALVLSSPMKRALDTSRLAGFSPDITADLSEWNYGEYEGRTTADIQKEAPGWTIWTAQPPSGESIDEVSARADRVIARAGEASGDVAIFGHGHMLRVLGARWIDLAPQAGSRLALATGTVSVLGYERDTRVIRVWNREP